jgi:hypothetical protein
MTSYSSPSLRPLTRVCFAVLWLCMGLWLAQQTVVAAEEPQLPIEEIQVTGPRSMILLGQEIRKAEVQMYNLFNELNSTDDFDVTCGFVKDTGTQISAWKCMVGFMSHAEHRNTQEFLQTCFSPVSEADEQVNTQGLPPSCFLPKTDEQLNWENREKLDAMNAEMSALAKENPALAQAMLDLYAKKQRMQGLQLSKRENSGRFFRKLFGRKEE